MMASGTVLNSDEEEEDEDEEDEEEDEEEDVAVEAEGVEEEEEAAVSGTGAAEEEELELAANVARTRLANSCAESAALAALRVARRGSSGSFSVKASAAWKMNESPTCSM